MLKNTHNDFPSDVFLSLETAGAVVDIVDAQNGDRVSVTVGKFPYINMNKKLGEQKDL